MTELKHKLICWDDYAIPVPLWVNWIAWDESGELHAYRKKPKRRHICQSTFWWNRGRGDYVRLSVFGISDIPPPESGPWTEQLYWVGD